MVDMPTSRAISWFAVGWPVRDRVVRLLADVEGLDGWAAAGAIAHAVRSNASPWAPLVDELFAEAFREMVTDPIGEAARALAEAFTPAVLKEPTGVCRCPCAMHKAAPRVCVGEAPARELVDYRFPRASVNMQRHTVRMCRPCAAAQSARPSIR